MPYSIEPFGFHLVQLGLIPPSAEEGRDRSGKHPSLFDELDNRQANNP